MGTARGIYCRDNKLVMGSFDGETFWVGWCFQTVCNPVEILVMGDWWKIRSVSFPVFMLYIMYWSVGVSLLHDSDHREQCPRTSWSDTWSVLVSTTWRPFPHIEDNVRTCFTPTCHHHGLHGTLGMVSYGHVSVTVTSCFCCILFVHIWVYTSYYWDLVVGLRTQFFTLLEVWGHWEFT
jgi:hypothetical protein